MTRHHLAAPALLVLALLASAAGFAADDAPRVIVRTDDLNLAAERGVRILYQRLRFASADVCPASGRAPARSTRALNCQAAVLERTIEQVALPRLTALHRERSGTASRLARR